MTFLVLHADRFATALTDDPIIPAADLAALGEAAALLAAAGTIKADAERAVAVAREAGRADGYEDGHAAGLEAGAADIRAELFRLAIRDGEERRQRQDEIATIALEVVRRIAGEIGDAQIVAGIAERATAALAPDTIATVRVAPPQVEAVAARLADRAGIRIEGDPTLAMTDCVVETALGATHAGLETQLAQIAAAWESPE